MKQILMVLVLSCSSLAFAEVTGAGPGAGTGVTDPSSLDHNMKPLEPGTPPNPKPIDGAIINNKVVPNPRMKRNRSASTTTSTTIITTTTVGSFR